MFKGGFQNYKQKEAESLENLRHLIGVLGQLPFVLVNWFAKCLFPTSCEFHEVTPSCLSFFWLTQKQGRQRKIPFASLGLWKPVCLIQLHQAI